MFKNLMIYTVTAVFPDSLTELEEALAFMPFQPCGAGEEKRVGWIPPRGQAHGLLVESVGGQWMLRFMAETRAVPAAVIQRRVQEVCEHIEATSGRKPGKKERRDLKEEAKAALLPQAFPRQQSVWVWLDPTSQLLMLDTSSSARADDILTALVKLLDGFVAEPLKTSTSPAAAMSTWLAEQTSPACFTIGQECELKSYGKGTPSVRYKSVPLLTDEVRDHIRSGKQPTRLALHCGNGIQFVLTDCLHLKKIKFEEPTVIVGQNSSEDGFDGNVMLATTYLKQTLIELIDSINS
ncbi:recombination associated protein [Caudoviricetes sp.]|nr:recombination associated protein [Caudoviricetes sp.]